jgi:MOSC domain-containing protein YiiM
VSGVRCPTCSFDPAQWSAADVQRTLNAVIVPWFHLLSEDAPADVAAALEPTRREIAALALRDDAEAMHRAWQLLADAGRLRHASGAGAATQTATVQQVSTSPGGVPKLPVASARVSSRGLVGDKQANRKHHGRPWQALCLWSAEVVDALAAGGHPIGYGCAGENLTLRGLDWRSIRPGVRLLIGTALVETTPYAIPCVKNARWFSDGRFRRMAHEVAPGTSRIYARVLVEGVVAAGAPVVVEPLTVPEQRTAIQTSLAFS